MQRNLETPTSIHSNGRMAGILIGLATMVMIVFMSHHPLPSPGDTEHFIKEVVEQGTASAVVHGALIGTVWLLLLGFTGLGDELGWNLLSVRAGVIAYAIGCVAMTAAALVDGFILPELARRYADRPAGDVETFRALLLLLYTALTAMARLGVLGFALAVVLWSFGIIRRRDNSAVGVLGLISGVITIALLLTGRLSMHFHDMMAFVLTQAAWYMAIAVLLIRRRL